MLDWWEERQYHNFFLQVKVGTKLWFLSTSVRMLYVKNLSKMPRCEFFENFQVRLTT